MHPPKQAQEVAQACPQAFQGVAVHLALPIAIVIARILALTVTHRAMPASRGSEPRVGPRLVGVDHRARLGGGLDPGLDGALLGVITDYDSHFAALAPNHPVNRRAVRLQRAYPAPLIRPPPRPVVGGAVGRALFSRVL